MIGFARFIAIIGIAITSFLTRREFKKMVDQEKDNDSQQ
jgi:hypothetical protein